MLVSKGGYIRRTYIWEAYLRDFTQSAFVNTNDMFIFNYFFAQERSMFIENGVQVRYLSISSNLFCAQSQYLVKGLELKCHVCNFPLSN